MSPKIEKIIDAEKIAAGEVIERPANVIKELIENSIDAGANEIKIIIKNAGRNLIQVIDDGSGISPDDIVIAFERHTSSKIRTIKDLENLNSLGFRGEALASIAAVSMVEITSRVEENEMGVKLNLIGGNVTDKTQVSCPIGTNIKIKNIFFNTPARKKFLKKDSTELGHISDIIQRYALGYPQKHISYIHNDLEILNCPLSNDLITTVFHIYGKRIARNLRDLNYYDSDLKLIGLIGTPEIAKKNRSHASFFINHRYILSDLLYRAVQDAYKGILMTSTYPFFILQLEIDPSTIDFNVHPKKLEIRFEDEEFIYNKVYGVLRKFIKSEFIKKERDQTKTELSKFVINTKENLDSIALKEGRIEEKKNIQLSLADHGLDGKKNVNSDFIPIEKPIINKDFPKLRFISRTGQLSNKIYIILEGTNLEGEEGVYFLDQHAASERIAKEYFINLFESSKKTRQRLINPLKVEVSPSERFFLLSEMDQFKKLGFTFEHFGGNSFVLREIPVIIQKTPKIKIINEIVSDITEIGKDRSFSEVKEQIINYLACHRSIRGGDTLNFNRIRKLISKLSKMKDPYHCAHGRPTLKFISFKELDKLFKRIV